MSRAADYAPSCNVEFSPRSLDVFGAQRFDVFPKKHCGCDSIVGAGELASYQFGEACYRSLGAAALVHRRS